MATCSRNRSSLKGPILDSLLGLFLLGLIAIVWLPTHAGASGESGANHTGTKAALSIAGTRDPLLPVQGTPLVATISGSIDGTEPTFTGQRHFRSGIRGDRNCALFGAVGSRPYDQFTFLNTSSTSQLVSIGFTSGCGGNTYMAAYSPQFSPTSICANFIASPGLSGSINWDFTVCANSQFSIVVYGLEPGLTCSSYLFNVYSNSAVFIGGPTPALGAPPSKDGESSNQNTSDVVLKRHKQKIPGTDTRVELVVPEGVSPPTSGLLPTVGTPLVATINDSISAADPAFPGQRHFISGIPGDANCVLFGPPGIHFYDEVFFRNNSPNIETVEIQSTMGCVSSQGPLILAVYSPQFNPSNICDGLIGVSGFFSGGSWSFRVCPNTQFSIVVYGAISGSVCPAYSYSVFSPSTAVTLIGTATDLSVIKTGPAGPIAVGSNLAYNITFANNGPRAAGGVVFTDPLPAGVTFVSLNLLTNLGTAPAPLCMTPPVGSAGTVSCAVNLLPVPGTGLINALTYALTVNVSPGAPASVVNTAFVSFQGMDTNPSNNSSSVTTRITGFFNLCLQDDSNRSVLQINSTTGDYLFSSCQGLTIGGTGTITVKGSVTTLQDYRSDRRILARVDNSVRTGTASIQLFSPASLFTITDRNTTDNTCVCP